MDYWMAKSPTDITNNSYYPDIDELPEHKTVRDSEVFQFEENNYKYSSIVDICKEFIKSYKRYNEEEYYYHEYLNQMLARQAITVVVDFNDIFDAQSRFTTTIEVIDEKTRQKKEMKLQSGRLLYLLIEENPKLFIKAFRKAAYEILCEIHYDYAIEIHHDFKCQISNATPFKKEITDIVSSDVGKLLYTEDFVVSISAQKNYTKKMAWSCGNCGRLTYKESIGFRLPRLKKCMYCESDDIREEIKDAVTDTMQEIKLQQKYERIISGRVPKTIIGVTMGKDMINPVQAGDICAVTGIVSLQPNPSPAENAIADYFIEIQWIEKKNDDFLIEDDPELEEKVKKFIDHKNEDEGYKNLIESIAPSVMGHEIIKEALLLQMVGSEVAYFQDNSRHRGEINLLLVGDAGTAKTKLAFYVYQLYARAIYVSSKVTEAGITASVNVATKSGTPILEAGAYLLASSDNGGLVVCDEMEKTDPKAKDAIAACLDDRQMVEIHKHTIHQSIQINCASLHIANPKTGESWNVEKTIKENTGFENWYLSRFITFIVRDEVEKELDTKKAKHFLAQFSNTRRQYKLQDGNINDIRLKQRLAYGDNKNIHSVPEMAMYNKYVRKHFKPEFDPTSKAGKKLQQYYISVRPLNAQSKGARVTIRALGDLIRFAEASARAHMRNEVTEKDADIAIKIVQASIASSGFNMFKGTYEEQILEQHRAMQKKGEPLSNNGSGGFFTAQELLENKTAREIISIDLARMAIKRQNRFYREVGTQMKKVVRVIRMAGLLRCRECKGFGRIRQGGNIDNVCYNCEGEGGIRQSFNINDCRDILRNADLTDNEIQEMISGLIKKKIITPKFNVPNIYELSKPYKDALLDLEAITANVDLAVNIEQDENNNNPLKNPEMEEKIKKLRSMMDPKMRETIRKQLEEMDDD